MLPKPTNNVPLITLVWFKGNSNESNAMNTVREMLSYSCGPYGTKAITGGDKMLSWAILLPDKYTNLTSWSVYVKNKEICLFEGDMYDDLPLLKIVPGDNPGLAEHIAGQMRSKGDFPLKDLNGIYSCIYVNADRSCAHAFDDPTGTRSVFYISNKRNFIMSNNLWAFRGFSGVKKKWDRMALAQMLTFGFPMSGRTVIEEVNQLQAGYQISSFADGRTKATGIFRPVERQSWSFSKTVSVLRESTDEAVSRIARRIDGPVGLALSGGLDSRIILSALHTQKIESHSFTTCIQENEADNVISSSAAKMLGEKHSTVVLDSKTAFSLYRDTRIINEGESQGFGFLLLAAEAQHYVNNIMLGSEVIRDTPFGAFWPMSMKSNNELASKWLNSAVEFFDPTIIPEILSSSYVVDWNDVLDQWFDSFNVIKQQSVFDVFLDWRLNNRQQRRTKPRLDAARWFCMPLYPYLDYNLNKTFRSTPLSHMGGEKCHLALLQSYETGIEKLPNAARSFLNIPIIKEYKYRHLVHFGRVIRIKYMLPLMEKFKKTKAFLGYGASNVVPLLDEELNSIRNCDLFNWPEVDKIITNAQRGKFTNRKALHKLIDLAVINDFLFGDGLSGKRSLKFVSSEREISFIKRDNNEDI